MVKSVAEVARGGIVGESSCGQQQQEIPGMNVKSAASVHVSCDRGGCEPSETGDHAVGREVERYDV